MKTLTKSKALAPNQAGAERKVLLRDLMKSIFVFGLGGQPLEYVTDLRDALARFKAGEDFYVYPGGDTLYHVHQSFYRASGIPRAAVRQQLHTVFPAPPEAVGL